MTGLTRSAAYKIILACGVLLLAGAAVLKPLRAPSPQPGQPVTAPVSAATPGGHPAPPQPGPPQLLAIGSTILEISWVSPEAQVKVGRATSPAASAFSVKSGGKQVPIAAAGMRQRAAYAPFKKRDLRITTSVFLQLSEPISENAGLEVSVSGAAPWPGDPKLSAHVEPQRFSPAIHVNQTGYLPGALKKAFVGYFMGTLGEADFGWAPGAGSFSVLDLSGREVFKGTLVARTDEGFPYPAYQHVWEADFSSLDGPGVYKLFVPALGTSWDFRVSEDVAGALARTYALGLYHQRCGAANTLPYTRFAHRDCHVNPAAVPDNSVAHENCNWTLATETEKCKDNARHTAQAMTNVSRSLYPFVNQGPVDVRGGHHDAGDYSKYTINSASFVHLLTIACDALPGLSTLDNLGLPESGDGKGDVLQEAKWEADFLAKMQDADGGFYFLVYPKGRRYESDVTPDRGDPQVVFPKTTSATAAAVAALAQCASSPSFKSQFPESVAPYLDKARRGWAFLNQAIEKHGKDGSYQRITHYGDEFMHDDELAWAAVELFLATGEAEFSQKVQEWFKPNDPELRRWGWMRLFDAQGNAVRSYALAAKTGRLNPGQLDPALYEAAQQEVRYAGDEQARRANQSAYGTSFPVETKRVRSAGWYFSLDAAFDLALAEQADANFNGTDFRGAIIENIGYEQGCNPINVGYLTGLGHLRQFEVVQQYAQNDRRMLPPIGIPLGNIQEGISWIDLYKNEPASFSIPSDEDEQAPYPFYDRWVDAFNLSQEFVILNQARGLAVTGWLMANTSLKNQPWKGAKGTIQVLGQNVRTGEPVSLQLTADGFDLSQASIMWETEGMLPRKTRTLEWLPIGPGPAWVEAEALLPDGRRVFGVLETTVRR